VVLRDRLNVLTQKKNYLSSLKLFSISPDFDQSSISPKIFRFRSV